MRRECTNCSRPFSRSDFVKDETKHMEAERRALGLEGVRFLYYRCPVCSCEDVFLDLIPLDGETEEQFTSRRQDLQAKVRKLHGADVEVVLNERAGPGRSGH